ncbi:MAG: MTAP family purine nucleoside phosphorylase [Candidatus Thermoplasmatota archaeon]|nr:MTAP family purine nucleoside phosphorylase [Candidatus Thermoplasmatota archaeon]
MRIGIIGGTGIYDMQGNPVDIETGYGSVTVTRVQHEHRELFFLPRHGATHGIPPHRINHHANIQALKNCGVTSILAVSTVGSMRQGVQPGGLVVPDDFIDFTGVATFFDDAPVHVDLSQPFCPQTRQTLLDAASSKGSVFEGVYITTHGPRFETPAEIEMLQQHGDVVGMTMGPEATLAREANICYASLCVVSNMAAGLQTGLSADEIAAIYEEMRDVAVDILLHTAAALPEQRDCTCGEAATRGAL